MDSSSRPFHGFWRHCRSAVLAVALTACASTHEQQARPLVDTSEHVGKIAQTRWDALVRKDFETAYAMISPASRLVLQKDVFARKAGKVSWLSAKVVKAECAESDLCVVDVEARYEFVVRPAKRVENVHRLQETWRNVDGSWWYVPSDT